jgi:hypothetical protein
VERFFHGATTIPREQLLILGPDFQSFGKTFLSNQ